MSNSPATLTSNIISNRHDPEVTQADDEEMDELIYLQDQFLKDPPIPNVRLVRTQPSPTNKCGGSSVNDISEVAPKSINTTKISNLGSNKVTKPKSLFAQRREAARNTSQSLSSTDFAIKDKVNLESIQPSHIKRASIRPSPKVTFTPPPTPLSSLTEKRTQYQIQPTTSSSTSTAPETTLEVLNSIKQQYFVNLPTEPEKLKWMISNQSSNDVDQLKLRFDFNGVPLASDTEISSFAGLHHHGEDPDHAGYSLQEIVLLINSSMAGQRVVALTILNKILLNIRQGKFNNQRCQFIIQMLMELNAPTSIRWCLNFKSVSVIVAAIKVIHTWLHFINPLDYDDIKVDYFTRDVSGYYLGYKGWSLAATTLSEVSEYGVSEYEVSDAKLLNYDIMLGFIHLNLLSELTNLLVSYRHQSHLMVLEIIHQLGQHSVMGATELMNTPSLIKTIYTRWILITHLFTASLNELPIFSTTHTALLVLRTVLQASKSLAQTILQLGYDVGLINLFKALSDSNPPFTELEVGLLLGTILGCLQLLASYGLYRYDPMVLIKPTLHDLSTDTTVKIRSTGSFRLLESFITQQFGLCQLPPTSLYTHFQFIVTKSHHLLTAKELPTDTDKRMWSSLIDLLCTAGMLLKSECLVPEQFIDVSNVTQILNQIINSLSQHITLSVSTKDMPYWNSGFRRLFPSLVSPPFYNVWQSVYYQVLPDLGMLRSILELMRYSGLIITKYHYQTITVIIMQFIKLLSEFPTGLITGCSPINHLLFTWLQLEPPSGLGSSSLQLVCTWYAGHFPDRLMQLDTTVLLRLGLPVAYHPPGFLMERSTNLYNQDISYELLMLDNQLPNDNPAQQLIGILSLVQYKYHYIATTSLSPPLLRSLTNNLSLIGDRIQLLKLIKLDINLLFDPPILNLLREIVSDSLIIESKLRSHLNYPHHNFPLLELSQLDKSTVFAYYLDAVKDLLDHYLNTGFHQPIFLPLFLSLLAMDTVPSEFRVVVWGSLITALPHLTTTKELPHHYLYPIETSPIVLDHQAHLILSQFITPTTNNYLYDIASHHLRENLSKGEGGHLKSKAVQRKLREYWQL